MTNREWKPGDVALVRALYGPDGDGEYRMVRARHGWMLLENVDWYWADSAGNVKGARPLVVIDPENLGDVGRLVEAYVAAMSARGRVGRGPMLTMQAALREFATPTPPRPEEPQGLGAVVEDAEGDRWVLYTNPRNDAPWCNGCASVDYADIAAVRILSKGVK